MMVNLLSRLLNEAPMIKPGAFSALLMGLSKLLDLKAAEHPNLTSARQKLAPKATIERGVATLPIYGMLMRRPDPFEMAFFNVEDTSLVLDEFDRVASSKEIGSIVLDIDSPGGFLTGGPEMAESVERVARRKPVVAFTGGDMASLAYWIGSQASTVIASKSADVGSIGVFATFVDYSRFLSNAGIDVEVFRNSQGTFKGAGVMGTSLSDRQREHIQQSIESSFTEFRGSVLKHRPDVKDEDMRGQTFSGADGKRNGMVDRIGDLHFAKAVARQMAQ